MNFSVPDLFVAMNSTFPSQQRERERDNTQLKLSHGCLGKWTEQDFTLTYFFSLCSFIYYFYFFLSLVWLLYVIWCSFIVYLAFKCMSFLSLLCCATCGLLEALELPEWGERVLLFSVSDSASVQWRQGSGVWAGPATRWGLSWV